MTWCKVELVEAPKQHAIGLTCAEKLVQRLCSDQNRGHMVGTEEEPVHTDETCFAGRREYNRGRMLRGDRPPNSTKGSG